jgi:LMBR1 domain-containing protein 1
MELFTFTNFNDLLVSFGGYLLLGCDGYDTTLCGGLQMDLFWDIFFWLIPIWIFVLIPFATFYYEADDFVPPHSVTGDSAASAPAKPRSRLSQTLCNVSVLMLFVALLFFVAYWFLSYSFVNIQSYSAGTLLEDARPAGVFFQTLPKKDEYGEVLKFTISEISHIQPNDALLLKFVEKKKGMEQISYRVEVSNFFGGFMTFIGWFFFALFGGIGLAALPTLNILAFTRRPRLWTPAELEEAKVSIQDRVNEMVEIGEQIKREREEKSKTSANQGIFASLFPTFFHKRSSTLREFKAAVHLLEEDVRDFAAYQVTSEKYNPLYPFLFLLIGLVSSAFSVCWILQCILYTLPDPPVTMFLNNLFEWFDNWFPLFGTLSVAFFTLYLLLCAIQGCFIFGMRFLCLSFYPMKVGKTYMSSFLFNMGLILFTSLPVVQFAVISFEDYAQNSTIRQIFSVQIKNLHFFVYFFENNVFIYAFLVIAFFTWIYMLCKRHGVEGAELRDRLKSRARGTQSGSQGQTTSSSTGETGEETFHDEIDDNYSSD